MSQNGRVMPFPSAAVPVIGQPVTLLSVMMPVTAALQCNCGGSPEPLMVIASVATPPCPGCGKVYNVAFNPTNGQLQIAVQKPEDES